MTFREIFKMALDAYGFKWCRACSASGSHQRGFVLYADRRTVHLDSEIATRSSLHRGLHEIGHCILPEKGLRRFEKEAQANRWAAEKMRAFGIPVPRKTVSSGRSYECRMKRWGDNIRKGGSR